MGLLHRGAANDCSHHWHVIESGWDCCHCKGHHGRKGKPATNDTTTCVAAADESMAEWPPDTDPGWIDRRRRQRLRLTIRA